MDAIFRQLLLDHTFFYHLGLFWALFLILSAIFFKPFQRLLEARHQRTVQDREAAEKLMAEADAKFEEYRRRIGEERAAARKDFDALITEAKREEAEILMGARTQAKQITQTASDAVQKQREEIRRQLEVDAESLAQQISQKLLAK